MQRIEKILAQKAAPKILEWASYGNLGKVTQNPHFLKKEQRGHQGKFFKNRPEPSLKKPKKTLRHMALSFYKYAKIASRLETILAQKVAQRVPELPSYCKFC